MDMDIKRFGLPFRGGMEEDDGVVELSLGLSIGGSSRKARRSGAAPLHRELGTGSGEAEANHGGSGTSISSSYPPPPLLPPFQRGDLADGLDPQRWRDMHAMRRQEARKKRHEKQRKKGWTWAGRDAAAPGGSSPPPEGACSLADRMALEAQEERRRVRDRMAREEEARHSDRRGGENQELRSYLVPFNPEPFPNANANPNAGANPNPSVSPNLSNPNLRPLGAHPFPVTAMQCPYPHVQYVPMANGFGFPYMMHCWPPSMSSVAGGPNPNPATNVCQPVPCRTFPPFSPSKGDSPLSSKVVDLRGGNGAGTKRAPSWTVSLGSNSSLAISDHQSNSLQGGSSGSSDIRSHVSCTPAESSHLQLSPQVSNLVQGQSEHSVSSCQIEPKEVDAVEAPFEEGPIPSSNFTQLGTEGDPSATQCNPAKLEGMVSVNKPNPAADESTPTPLSSPQLPRMPCVSTTGNGPNGKTITGFLYRYTSTEVSIVCVCHGSSFSPAEFVKHAGGTDIANPLRHIIVIPS